MNLVLVLFLGELGVVPDVLDVERSKLQEDGFLRKNPCSALFMWCAYPKSIIYKKRILFKKKQRYACKM